MPRRLGQHFLTSDTVLEQLAKAACGEQTQRVIEVGPGRGALTRHLLPYTGELVAIEIDERLVGNLKRKFAGEEKLKVHQGDVLATDLTQWGTAVIAGNLPYYITSPIIERFLSLDANFPLAVFLMQWEVAQRLTAKSGTKDFGYLTVATRLVCEVELICKVPPGAFDPPPKVDSGAVRLVRKPGRIEQLPQLLKFVGRCFAQKRKTLRNNLLPFYGRAADALPEAGLRAEQLQLEQFHDLFARLSYTEEL